VLAVNMHQWNRAHQQVVQPLAVAPLQQGEDPAARPHPEPEDDGQGDRGGQGTRRAVPEHLGLALVPELADRLSDPPAECLGHDLPVDALQLGIRVQHAQQQPVLGDHQARDGGLPHDEGIDRHTPVRGYLGDPVRDLPGPPFGGVGSSPADLEQSVPVEDDRRGRLDTFVCAGGLRRGRDAARQRRESEENRVRGPEHRTPSPAWSRPIRCFGLVEGQ